MCKRLPLFFTQVSSFLKTVLLPKFLKSREYVSLELYLREVSRRIPTSFMPTTGTPVQNHNTSWTAIRANVCHPSAARRAVA